MNLWQRLRTPPHQRQEEGSLETQISAFLAESGGGDYFSPRLIERVGAAERCLQLNAQQIATMPLRFRGSYEPAWISNPDPNWYPNGITDALFAATYSTYARGDAFLWVVDRYEDTGYPRTWTVLDPITMEVKKRNGRRVYRSNGYELDPDDVLQVSRNPTGKLRGTSALESWAGTLNSASAATRQTQGIFARGGIPWAVLKSQKQLTETQAKDLQAQWVERVSSRLGAPAILPPDLDFEQLAFTPKDLMLLELREFDSRAIAAAFGVPAILLNVPITGGLVYQNPAMLTDLWWRTELMPAAHRVEQALTTRWLPRGNWVEFDPSIILRPDPKGLADMWLNLLKQKVVTINEVRRAVLDLDELEVGEAFDEIDEPPGADTSGEDEDEEETPRLEAVT